MNNGLLCVEAVEQPAKILMASSWAVRADAVQPLIREGFKKKTGMKRGYHGVSLGASKRIFGGQKIFFW